MRPRCSRDESGHGDETPFTADACEQEIFLDVGSGGGVVGCRVSAVDGVSSRLPL